MQSVQQELWALLGPRVHTHIGDLAWWATMHVGREAEWERRLWLDGERCVAWAWLRRPASLDHEVHLEPRGEEDLLQEEGAETAIVYAGGREEDEAARWLYESVGFRQHTCVLELRKDR
jgi:hypothetical protein